MANAILMRSFQQGKAVSNRNVTIATNRILDAYVDKPVETNDKNLSDVVQLETELSSKTSSNPIGGIDQLKSRTPVIFLTLTT